MDADVEAMLDAPYQEKRDEPMPSHREHHSSRDHSSRDHQSSRDHRDYYRDEEHRSRHSEHRHSSRSQSGHRSSRHRSDSSRRYRRSSLSRERRHRRSPSREYKRRSSSRRHSRSPTRRRRSRTPPSIHHDPHDRFRDGRRRGRGRSPSPPVPEEIRDRRTVFVTQLAARLTRRELEDFFNQAGRVREATIITDRNSRKSKGCGYVEFYEEVSVQNALALSGQKLLGIPVIVQMSEAEKNRLAMQAQRHAMGLSQEPAYQRLYVGSLHFSLTEDDVRQIFEPFGPLDFVNLHKETGRSKGFGFIQYKNAADAKNALEKMNGFELAGRNLKVGLVTEKNTLASGLDFSLDDEETEGVAMNSLSRAELMAKLAARESNNDHDTSPVAATPSAPPKPFIPAAASRYVMLSNMFNPDEETDPDWVSDLEADIKLECERYGDVEHIKVNADSMGEVFLKFDSVRSAENAIGALNGRWFGGRQITASCISEAIYKANAL